MMTNMDRVGLFVKKKRGRKHRICFYLDWTIYDAPRLSSLIKENGGKSVQNSYVADYILASTTTDSYSNQTVISESYITDCIKAEKLLPTQKYILENKKKNISQAANESLRKVLRSRPKAWEKITDHSENEIPGREENPSSDIFGEPRHISDSDTHDNMENTEPAQTSNEPEPAEEVGPSEDSSSGHNESPTKEKNESHSVNRMMYQFRTYDNHYPQPKMSSTRGTYESTSRKTPIQADLESVNTQKSLKHVQITGESDASLELPRVSPDIEQDGSVAVEQENSVLESTHEMLEDASMIPDTNFKTEPAIIENFPENSHTIKPEQTADAAVDDSESTSQLIDDHKTEVLQSIETNSPVESRTPSNSTVAMKPIALDGAEKLVTSFRDEDDQTPHAGNVLFYKRKTPEAESKPVKSASNVSKKSQKIKKEKPGGYARRHRSVFTAHDDHVILTAVTCPVARRLKKTTVCDLIASVLTPPRTSLAVSGHLKKLQSDPLKRAAAETTALEEKALSHLRKFQHLCEEHLESAGAEVSRPWTDTAMFKPFTNFDWTFGEKDKSKSLESIESPQQQILETDPVQIESSAGPPVLQAVKLEQETNDSAVSLPHVEEPVDISVIIDEDEAPNSPDENQLILVPARGFPVVDEEETPTVETDFDFDRKTEEPVIKDLHLTASPNSKRQSSPLIIPGSDDENDRITKNENQSENEKENENENENEADEFAETPAPRRSYSMTEFQPHLSSPFVYGNENIRAFKRSRISDTAFLNLPKQKKFTSSEDLIECMQAASEGSENVVEIMMKLGRLFKKESSETLLRTVYVTTFDLGCAVELLLIKQDGKPILERKGVWTDADDELLMNEPDMETILDLGDKHGTEAVKRRKRFLDKVIGHMNRS